MAGFASPFRIAAAVLVAVFAIPAPAQQGPVPFEDHPGHQPEPYDPETAQLAEGEVRDLDRRLGTITVTHGPIPSLAMPAMTMEFRVTDTTAMETLKPGDRVKFEADFLGGVLTVIRMERVK